MNTNSACFKAQEIIIDNPGMLVPILIHSLLTHIMENSPAELYYDNELKRSEMALYRCLVKNAKYTKEIKNEYYPVCRWSNKDLSLELKLTTRSIELNLTSLAEKEYITRVNQITSQGIEREIILRKWTGNQAYIDLTFLQYPKHVQIKLLTEAYRKHFCVKEHDSLTYRNEFEDVLESINGHGIMKWLSKFQNIYKNYKPMKLAS